MRITKAGVAKKPAAGRAGWWVGGVIVVLTLAIAVGVMGRPRPPASSLNLVVRHPRLALAAWRARRTMPTVNLSVDFTAYQQWRAAQDRLSAGEGVVTPQDCVLAEIGTSGELGPATLCPHRWSGARPGTPPFEVTMAEGEGLLGIRHATFRPAGAESVLGVGFLRSLDAAGLPVPELRFVHLVVNGSGWGIYAMETSMAEALSADPAVSPGSILVSFDARRLPTDGFVGPDAGFAYADVTLTSLDATDQVTGATLVAPATSTLEAQATSAGVVQLLARLERGEVAPREVLDPDEMGQLIAATALWYGGLSPDWQTLYLIYDPTTGMLHPTSAGWRYDVSTPLPPSFSDDAQIQSAVARRLSVVAPQGYPGSTVPLDQMDALYVALGGAPGALEAELAKHQATILAELRPARTLVATATGDTGVIRLQLRAVLPFPVEVSGLDFGEQGSLTLDPAWATGDGLVDGAGAVVLRAQVGADPVEVAISVPPAALPETVDPGLGGLVLTTRLWGLNDVVRVSVDAGMQP